MDAVLTPFVDVEGTVQCLFIKPSRTLTISGCFVASRLLLHGDMDGQREMCSGWIRYFVAVVLIEGWMPVVLSLR